MRGCSSDLLRCPTSHHGAHGHRPRQPPTCGWTGQWTLSHTAGCSAAAAAASSHTRTHARTGRIGKRLQRAGCMQPAALKDRQTGGAWQSNAHASVHRFITHDARMYSCSCTPFFTSTILVVQNSRLFFVLFWFSLLCSLLHCPCVHAVFYSYMDE